MSNKNQGPENFSDFDAEFEKPAELTAAPDGAHVIAIKGLRRHTTKAGDCWVTVDASCVASKIDGAITREHMGKEWEIPFYLPVDVKTGVPKDNKKIRSMNIENCKKFLAMAAGQAMPGRFSTDFEQWQKMVVGLHLVITQKTSDPNEAGKRFVNFYPDKPYTLTDEDRKLLGSASAGGLSPVPF